MDGPAYVTLTPTARALCRHCGEPISQYETETMQRWYHDAPANLPCLPRRGCDAASYDRRYATGDPGWDGYPKHLTATPA
jgi:hypothetical protein